MPDKTIPLASDGCQGDCRFFCTPNNRIKMNPKEYLDILHVAERLKDTLEKIASESRE